MLNSKNNSFFSDHGTLDLEKLKRKGHDGFCYTPLNRKNLIVNSFQTNSLREPKSIQFDDKRYFKSLREQMARNEIYNLDYQKLINDCKLIIDTFFYYSAYASLVVVDSSSEYKFYNSKSMWDIDRKIEDYSFNDDNSFFKYYTKEEFKDSLVLVSSIYDYKEKGALIFENNYSEILQKEFDSGEYEKDIYQILIKRYQKIPKGLNYELLTNRTENKNTISIFKEYYAKSAIFVPIWNQDKLTATLLLSFPIRSILFSPEWFEFPIDINRLGFFVKNLKTIINFQRNRNE